MERCFINESIIHEPHLWDRTNFKPKLLVKIIPVPNEICQWSSSSSSICIHSKSYQSLVLSIMFQASFFPVCSRISVCIGINNDLFIYIKHLTDAVQVVLSTDILQAYKLVIILISTLTKIWVV